MVRIIPSPSWKSVYCFSSLVSWLSGIFSLTIRKKAFEFAWMRVYSWIHLYECIITSTALGSTCIYECTLLCPYLIRFFSPGLPTSSTWAASGFASTAPLSGSQSTIPSPSPRRLTRTSCRATSKPKDRGRGSSGSSSILIIMFTMRRIRPRLVEGGEETKQSLVLRGKTSSF